jgi:hypothetical protein
MLALHGGSPGTGHIQAVIGLIAIFTVIFWRDVAKIQLFVILVAFGAVVLIDGALNVIK